MPYEIFDPSSVCNPPVPLNKITNKLTFFKINVFEASLSKLIHYPDGKMDGPVNQSDLGYSTYRLGIPLTDLFPFIRPQLKTKYIKGFGPGPMRVGIEGVYLPVNKDYAKQPEIKHINIYNDDIKKGFIRIGGVKIKTSEVSEELEKNGFAYYKKGGKIFKLSRPSGEIIVSDKDKTKSGIQTAIGKMKLSKSELNEFNTTGFLKYSFKGNDFQLKSSGLKGGPTPPPGALFFEVGTGIFDLFDPQKLEEETYFMCLGDILYDERSGMKDKGIDSQEINFSVLEDKIYYQVLTNYRNDPRYERYFNRTTPSDTMSAGAAKLPAYEIGLYTSFEQNWELLGYSRGVLLNSITLSPKEEISIEVFSFDRLKLEQENEFTTEFEKNLEITSLAKASAEISRDLTTTTDVNADVGLGIPLPIEGVPVNVDVSGGVSNQVKEGIQSSINHINEVTKNSSEKFKSKTRVKIVQTREKGEETRTIRKIFNPNASKTLTLNYFELLETYKITTNLKDTKRFCLLVDNPDLGAIDINFVLAYEDRLQKSLLSPNYLAGFEAAKKLAAQRWFDKKSELKLEIESSNDENESKVDTPKKPLVRVAINLKKKLKKFLDVDLMKAAGVLSKHYDPFLPEDQKPSKKKVSNAEDSLGLFNFWAKFKIASPGVESKSSEFVEKINNSVDEAFAAEQLELFLTGMDDEWLTAVKMIAINIVAFQLSSMLVIPFPLLSPLILELALINNDDGLPGMIDKAKAELKNFEMVQSAATAVQPPASGDPATVSAAPVPPPQLFSLEDLAMANAEFEKLVLHLEANKSYYMNKLLLFEDSNQRYERLKIKGIINHIENRVIGFVGNKSVFPLKIETLDKATSERLTKELAKFKPEKDENIDGIDTSKIELKEEVISLPTAGVYAESMLGKCDALEQYLLDRRVIEKQMAQAQADMAVEKVNEQKQENNRLAERIKQGVLDNPFK